MRGPVLGGPQGGEAEKSGGGQKGRREAQKRGRGSNEQFGNNHTFTRVRSFGFASRHSRLTKIFTHTLNVNVIGEKHIQTTKDFTRAYIHTCIRKQFDKIDRKKKEENIFPVRKKIWHSSFRQQYEQKQPTDYYPRTYIHT